MWLTVRNRHSHFSDRHWGYWGRLLVLLQRLEPQWVLVPQLVAEWLWSHLAHQWLHLAHQWPHLPHQWPHLAHQWSPPLPKWHLHHRWSNHQGLAVWVSQHRHSKSFWSIWVARSRPCEKRIRVINFTCICTMMRAGHRQWTVSCLTRGSHFWWCKYTSY